MVKPDGQPAKRRSMLKEGVRWILLHARLPVILAALAILLTLPSVGSGLLSDDYFHRLTIRGSHFCPEFDGSVWHMFRFFKGDPQRTQRLMDYGVLPWWTVTTIKGEFCRPVTVLTHWLDYRLWPDTPALMHAQSLVWFGLLVACATLLYRRIMGPTVAAGLAALLYAIDDTHGMPVGWLANRNALIAAAFGVLTILAHDRWRRDRWPAGIIIAPLCLAASLLSGEAGLATCAYLAAHAVFVDHGRWRQRCLTLVPYIVVVILWRLLWTWLGYGVTDVGLYVDPVAEPWRYARALIERAPILLLAQWAGPPAETSVLLSPASLSSLQLAAIIFLVVLVAALAPLLRRDTTARFWAAGMVLALLPACTTFPADRMLSFVGIGAMGLLAQFLQHAFTPSTTPGRRLFRWPARIVAGVLVPIHFILAPLALPLRAAWPAGAPKLAAQLSGGAPMDHTVTQQDVVIVNAPMPILALYLPILRELDGQPVPRHTRVLAPALPSVQIKRPDTHTLLIRPRNGYLVSPLDLLFRDERYPMHVNQRVALTGMTATVTGLTNDGRPLETEFRFAVPLEDPSLRWLQWKDGKFVPFTPPKVGETIELQAKTPAILPGST